MWPCEIRAASSESDFEVPKVVSRNFAISLALGVFRFRWRQRDLIVGITSWRVGAQRSQTV